MKSIHMCVNATNCTQQSQICLLSCAPELTRKKKQTNNKQSRPELRGHGHPFRSYGVGGAPFRPAPLNLVDAPNRKRQRSGNSSNSSSSSSLLCGDCYSRTRRPSGMGDQIGHHSCNYCPACNCGEHGEEEQQQHKDSDSSSPKRRPRHVAPAPPMTSPGGLVTEEG